MYFQKDFQAAEIPSKNHISCYRYNSDEKGSFPLHCHPYYEISYILRGERYEIFNGMKYRVKENSLFFIPPLAIHGIENITPVEDIFLQFSSEFLSGCSSSMQADTKLFLRGDKPFAYIESEKIISELISLSALPNCYDFRNYSEDCRLEKSVSFEWKRNGLILSIMTNLLEQGIVSIANTGADQATLIQMEPLINRMLMYPEENLDMKEAARMVGASYYHFSRLF